jgi:hypothetical protein
MHRWWSRAAALAVCLAVAPASADELRTSFEAGFRTGLAFPLGDIAQDAALVDSIAWSVPLQIDAGARIGPAFVGGYFSYAFGKAGSKLDNLASKSASDLRVGFEVLWHFAPGAAVDPWAGLGIGYEWLNFSAPVGTSTVSVSVRGFEFVNAQAGLDFTLGSLFRIGPCVLASLGQYATGSGDITGTTGGTVSGTSDIQNKRIHAWLSVGLRMALVL